MSSSKKKSSIYSGHWPICYRAVNQIDEQIKFAATWQWQCCQPNPHFSRSEIQPKFQQKINQLGAAKQSASETKTSKPKDKRRQLKVIWCSFFAESFSVELHFRDALINIKPIWCTGTWHCSGLGHQIPPGGVIVWGHLLRIRNQWIKLSIAHFGEAWASCTIEFLGGGIFKLISHREWIRRNCIRARS